MNNHTTREYLCLMCNYKTNEHELAMDHRQDNKHTLIGIDWQDRLENGRYAGEMFPSQ